MIARRSGRRCIPGGPNVDATADQLVADGVLTPPDADAIHQFSAFLRDSASGKGKPGDPVPTAVMWQHREFLGLSDDEVRDVAARRGDPDPSTEGEQHA